GSQHQAFERTEGDVLFVTGEVGPAPEAFTGQPDELAEVVPEERWDGTAVAVLQGANPQGDGVSRGHAPVSTRGRWGERTRRRVPWQTDSPHCVDRPAWAKPDRMQEKC